MITISVVVTKGVFAYQACTQSNYEHTAKLQCSKTTLLQLDHIYN